MKCNDCDEEFSVIYNNVPWLSIDYCPFCGGDDIESSKDEGDEDDSDA